MSAKEMFEKLGFTQMRVDEEEYKEYMVIYGKGDIEIEFSKYCKVYSVSCGDDMSCTTITISMHEAIHQQMIELGWLDE